LTSRNLAKKIAGFAFSKKASDVQLLDLRKVSDVADFFVLCSADSDVQVKAIADAVLDGLAETDIHPWHREGVSQKQWILLDFIDVVVHVFHKDARKFYGLEKLWGDAKIEVVADEEAPPRKKAAAAVKPAAGRSDAATKAQAATKSSAGAKAPAATKVPTARKSPSAGRPPAARKTPKK
jgi:ribosome-associated protein